MQHSPRLANVVVSRHSRHCDLLLVKRRRRLQNHTPNLTQHTQNTREPGTQMPHTSRPTLITGRGPNSPREIPEVHRRIVGDEEGLAVDALVVQGDLGRDGGASQEEARG